MLDSLLDDISPHRNVFAHVDTENELCIAHDFVTGGLTVLTEMVKDPENDCPPPSELGLLISRPEAVIYSPRHYRGEFRAIEQAIKSRVVGMEDKYSSAITFCAIADHFKCTIGASRGSMLRTLGDTANLSVCANPHFLPLI